MAQARLFESILHTEVIELQELAYRVSRSSGRRRGAEGVPPSQHLLRIQARIGEARRLLRALQDRFPHPA
ncbi:hypothetical protein [Mycobacterium sp.]|uniref:hypothetical protein n=1 Tax=Mycobacterium sp. TaxID=1785 RepID=UPI0031E48203